MTKTVRCYACKSKIRLVDLPYFWEQFRGYERPHCSEKCRGVTRARKAQQEQALREVMQ